MIKRHFFIISGVVFSIIVSSLLTSCSHDPVFADNADTICFDQQVFPILQTSCGISGCHDGIYGSEGFSVANYDAIRSSVTPGDPKNSTLYKVITDIWGENMMPPDRPLTLEQRTIIHLWIAQGAENTVCSADTNPGGGIIVTNDSVCFNQKILPLLLSNCSMTGCHDGNSQGEEDELYALNSYETVRPHVVPYNPSQSSIYRAVTGSGEEFMPPPPKPPLISSQKELLRKWIADGALNNDCPGANCDTIGIVSFTQQVKPVIDNFCVSCHNSVASSGGVNLNGYTQVKTYAEILRNGTPVLLGVIQHLSGFKAMPPSTKLDDCSIRKIELWVEQGRLDN